MYIERAEQLGGHGFVRAQPAEGDADVLLLARLQTYRGTALLAPL